VKDVACGAVRSMGYSRGVGLQYKLAGDCF